MKIIGLRCDGIRKLTAIEMEFKDKGIIPIKGKNKQGKSTIIDTIEWMLRGNKVANPQLIQNGKDRAEAEITLGKYRIKRIMNGKGSKLEVKNLETGISEKGEVQNFLNAFINELTFNPRPFQDKTSLDKLKFCLELFKDKLETKSKELLGYGFSGIDTKLLTFEGERLLVGREIKKFGDLDEDAPEKVERVDISATLSKKTEIEKRNTEKRIGYDAAKQKEIEKINEFNQTQSYLKEKLSEHKNEVTNYTDKVNSSKKKIENLKEQLLEEESNLEALQSHLTCAIDKLMGALKPEPEKPLTPQIPEPEYETTSNEDALIQNALAINQKAEVYESWLRKKNEKSAKENEYEDYNQKIKSLRDKKLEILRDINTGVKGLEIREDGIYYNDVYSENWSDSENLRISAELCLSQMPQLRTVFIDGAEAMDSDSLKDLESWAIENDVQCIVTIVSDLPKEANEFEEGVFYIEEGKLVEAVQ
jgi:DNA repair exonuclease SbcCD ATPase subunit